jgi:hypothetical protein
MFRLIYKKPLLGPKSSRKGSRNATKLMVKMGCDIENKKFL